MMKGQTNKQPICLARLRKNQQNRKQADQYNENTLKSISAEPALNYRTLGSHTMSFFGHSSQSNRLPLKGIELCKSNARQSEYLDTQVARMLYHPENMWGDGEAATKGRHLKTSAAR